MKCFDCKATLNFTGTSYHYGFHETRAYKHYKCPGCGAEHKTIKRTPKRKEQGVRVQRELQ